MSFKSFNFYHFIRETLFPIVLMISLPNIIILISYNIVIENCTSINQIIIPSQFFPTLFLAWKSVNWLDLECWSIVLGQIIWGFISLHLSGKIYHGPPMFNNNRPIYRDSGFKFYLISMLVAVPLVWKYPVLHLYYKIPTLFAILSLFGFIFYLFVYLKGLTYPDHGIHNITSNPIFDFYWGIELNPYLKPFVSLKVLIISRFGMFLWQLIALIAWKANYELNINNNDVYIRSHIDWPMTTTTLLVTLSIAKHYYWESGYIQTSLDIIHDRFGFYLCWGPIAFLPGFYSLNSLFLVKNSPIEQFGFPSFVIVFCLGVLSFILVYWIDIQRYIARNSDGKCKIFGKPAKVLRATYFDDSDETQQSILLCSGFWGFARHLNYTFELLAAFLTCVPALFSSRIPYLSFIVLFALIIHRVYRDNDRCAQKYTKYWQKYCKLVPYKMIPGLY